MKKTLLFGVIVFTILIANVGFAQLKVGIVDIQQIVQNDPGIKAWQTEMQKNMAPKSKAIISSRNGLLKDLNDFKKMPATKVLARKKLREEIGEKAKDLRDSEMQLRKELMMARQSEIEALRTRIEKAVNTVAAQKKLDLVLKKSSTLFYGNALQASDITDAVSKLLQAK